jgi:hypothetical protein
MLLTVAMSAVVTLAGCGGATPKSSRRSPTRPAAKEEAKRQAADEEHESRSSAPCTAISVDDVEAALKSHLKLNVYSDECNWDDPAAEKGEGGTGLDLAYNAAPTTQAARGFFRCTNHPGTGPYAPLGKYACYADRRDRTAQHLEVLYGNVELDLEAHQANGSYPPMATMVHWIHLLEAALD